jgi:hypothetical protein
MAASVAMAVSAVMAATSVTGVLALAYMAWAMVATATPIMVVTPTMEVATVISCGGALWDHMDGSISGA